MLFVNFVLVFDKIIFVLHRKLPYLCSQSLTTKIIFAMKNITYLLLCCLLFICSSLHAQQTDIKGIVSDSSGEPLPGVSISIKGTTFGTITNMDGQFTIRAKKGNTLIFSFIGYQTVEQKATDTPMKVTLQESSVQVDEFEDYRSPFFLLRKDYYQYLSHHVPHVLFFSQKEVYFLNKYN